MNEIKIDSIESDVIEGTSHGEHIYFFMDTREGRLVIRFELLEGIARIDQIHHREDSIQIDAHMQAIARAEYEIMEMIGVEAVVTLGDQHAVYY